MGVFLSGYVPEEIRLAEAKTDIVASSSLLVCCAERAKRGRLPPDIRS
jgi:hypothetical protein